MPYKVDSGEYGDASTVPLAKGQSSGLSPATFSRGHLRSLLSRLRMPICNGLNSSGEPGYPKEDAGDAT